MIDPDDSFKFVKFHCPNCGVVEMELKFRGVICPNCDTEMISDE